MKTLNKIILILFFIICCELLFSKNVVMAAEGDVIPLLPIDIDVSKIKPDGSGVQNAEGLMPIIGKILGFLQVTSGLLAVVIIAVTGVNYVVFTPSDMRGEMKHKMLPLVLGVVLVFGAVSIAKFVVSVFS